VPRRVTSCGRGWAETRRARRRLRGVGLVWIAASARLDRGVGLVWTAASGPSGWAERRRAAYRGSSTLVRSVPLSPNRLTLTTDGPSSTRAAAAAIAAVLEVGDVVALSGELGAGKTCFVQGAASGLGIDARVTSPTFVLVREYRGRVPMVHTDVYRLDRLTDVRDLGDDVMSPEVVTFIEWADAVAPLLPDDRLEVEILHGPDQDAASDQRRILLAAYGARWATRMPALAEQLTPWR
jgi:tRNA threonylcarbamoyladenosine biosynthesis protein TsaE